MSASPDVARLCDLLARLVAIDTQNPPGREIEAAELLTHELSALGFASETRTLGPGRANAIARFSNGAGPTLILNSHIDTVPIGSGWTMDPFRLTERGGRLYGRGACDAKGSIAAMVEAGRLLIDAAASWRGTLMLAFVSDEEIDGTACRSGRDRRTHRQSRDGGAQGLPAASDSRDRQDRALQPAGARHQRDPRRRALAGTVDAL
jgi:acetylornithine deacetylase/succinyl-diaminopimelate desuccinylase-like protein